MLNALAHDNWVLTLIQIGLIEVVWPRDIHIVQACDIAMASEVLQQLHLAQSALG